MGKSNNFYGQSVLGLLISLIDDTTISRSTRKHKSDRYVKRFTTKDHLISMLFCAFAKRSSLREVSGAMIGLSGKTKHFQLQNLPYRSTLSDANKRRDPEVFADIVTRIKNNAAYKIEEELLIEDSIHSGVVEDKIIKLHSKESRNWIRLRKVTFYDRVNKRQFEFLTNLFDMRPDMIAAIYKLRWQIELLYKQLKQNFPLKYFLGDNENAIKIQIYCTLIVNLLLTVIQKQLKRRWAFSNLVSFCRIHLFNYIHLIRFLENPEKDWVRDKHNHHQLNLFEQGALVLKFE